MFLATIGKLRGDYQGIKARIIAYNWGENWVNLASRFVLSPDLRKTPYLRTKSLAKVSELCLFGDTLPIGELDRVLDVFRKGQFSVDGKMILYKRWMNQKWDTAYSPVFSVLKRSDYESWVGSETFAYALRGGDSGMQQFGGNEGLRQIESKLASLRTPFVSLTDFATDFIGPLVVPNVWGYPSAEVLAPIRARFVSPCQIQDGEVQYHFEMEKGYKRSQMSIGYAAFSGERAFSRGRTTNLVLTKESPRTQTYRGSIRFPSSAESVTLLLSYRGEEVDRQSLHRTAVAGENIRMAVYEKSDLRFEKFSAGLAPEDRKARGFFEESIRLLFSFLGFSCVKPPTQESVDIVAFTDNPLQVLLIECTTETPGLRDKLNKLASRRTLYGKAAHAKPIAVIVTPLRRNDIAGIDQERASRDGLILVGEENLMKMVEMANRGKTIGATIRYLQTLAPLGAF